MTAQKAIQVKICGATDPTDLQLLDRAGVDYAGLWFHVPFGKYSLERRRFLELSRTPVRRVRCVGVTSEGDPDVLVNFVCGAGISGVQLHGFQLPKVVQTCKSRLGDQIEVFKVLHVQGGECLERPLLGKYAVCGADAFILDSFVSRQQPGSTGKRIPPTAVAELSDALGMERLFLAGGIDEVRIRQLRSSALPRGVDIDTGARVASKIDPQRVSGIVTAAQGCDN